MKKTMIVALCALALATLGITRIEAQGPPPGGPAGGPGGGMMRGPGGGEGLLLAPDVQKELKLTEEQITKIQKLFDFGPQNGGPPPQRGGQPGAGNGRRGPGGPPQGGGPGGRGPGGGSEMEKQVKEILTAAQFTRFQELRLQSRGAMAILQDDVAAKLGLTNSQREQLERIMEKSRPGPRGGQGGTGGPPDFSQMEKQRAETEKAILGVLTSDQKAKWNLMLGKPFKFEQRGMGPGGHGGPPQGGPGGGGRRGGGGG